MKAIILQHTDYEDAGYVETWLAQRNADVQHVYLFQPEHEFPAPESFDLLVICGGPMGAYEEDKYPWLINEKAFIRSAIEADKKVLGLCLGGQLIASCLGAEIRKSPQPEIGWFELTAENQDADVFHIPPSFPIMEWHFDMFDLPPGATLLASSAACKNQMYQIGKNIMGTQCHPEMTARDILFLIDTYLADFGKAEGIQDYDTIKKGVDLYAANANQLMADMLVYLTQDL
ncbi:MAG: GMP synthase [Oceanospirillaceae bacterium]|nr:GMP synthase [Oceanospirillaceae bacterium]